MTGDVCLEQKGSSQVGQGGGKWFELQASGVRGSPSLWVLWGRALWCPAVGGGSVLVSWGSFIQLLGAGMVLWEFRLAHVRRTSPYWGGSKHGSVQSHVERGLEEAGLVGGVPASGRGVGIR